MLWGAHARPISTTRLVPSPNCPATHRQIPPTQDADPTQAAIIAMAFSIKQTGSDGKPKRRRLETVRTQSSMHDERPTISPYFGPLHQPRTAYGQTLLANTTKCGDMITMERTDNLPLEDRDCLCPTTDTTRTYPLAPPRPTLRIRGQRVGLQQIRRHAHPHLKMPVRHPSPSGTLRG